MMTKQEIFDLLNKNPMFYLATLENKQPRVRGMLLYKADETGIVFHTGTMKDVFKQIWENPNVEMCFSDNEQFIQVRISGKLEIVNDNNFKDEICEHPSRGFLKKWRESGTIENFYEAFAVFRLQNGIATTWTMEKNFTPKEEIQL